MSNLARKEPVLILFEDAHWSDPTSIELLDAVIEQVPALPVLLIVSYRPEFVAPWFDRPNVSLMALSRLDRRDATALAAQVVKDRVLSSPLLERIVLQSDGVPLFIEELTRAVLEAPELDALGRVARDTRYAASLADGAPRSVAGGQDGCADRLRDWPGVFPHAARVRRGYAGRRTYRRV